MTAVVGATDEARIVATLVALDGQVAPSGGWHATVYVLAGGRQLTELVEAWVDRAPAARSMQHWAGADPSWRRTALARAHTDVVAFVAEGAVVPPTWVYCHACAFERPEVGAATGSVGLSWLVPRPEWWTAEHDSWSGVVEVGDRALTLDPGARLSRHNASLRRTAAGAVGPQTAIFDDEHAMATTLVSTLGRSGWHAVRLPEAPAILQVRAEDVTATAMLRQGWAVGRRSITPEPAGARRSHARLRLASTEVWAATRAMRRAARIPRAERTGVAIAGSIHLGRAASLVESVRTRAHAR